MGYDQPFTVRIGFIRDFARVSRCHCEARPPPPWRDISWTMPKGKNPVWARERSGCEAEPKQTQR